MPSRVLVVAAHPDDEVLGVGGTLLKHCAQGDRVFVCIATKAHEPQWSKEYMAGKVREQKRFDRFVGVEARFNLDFPTTTLNAIPHGEINSRVAQIVDTVKPSVLYTHFEGDLNRDHGVVSHACLVAARPPKRIKLLTFETPSESEWNHEPFLPNLWVDIGGYLEKKLKAFQIYKSEVKKHPHPRSPEGLRALALRRGSEICVWHAEAFRLIRDVQL